MNSHGKQVEMYTDKPYDIRVLNNSINLSRDTSTIILYISGRSTWKKVNGKRYVSCGILTVENGEVTNRLYKSSEDPVMANMKNVGAELFAVNTALESILAFNDLKKRILIHTNFKGLIHWGNGSWYCTNPYAQNYKKLLQEVGNKMKVEIIFVNSKSTNCYSKEVNELALDVLRYKSLNQDSKYDINSFVRRYSKIEYSIPFDIAL